MTAFLNPLTIEPRVRDALDEDLGRAGDITTFATIPAGTPARAVIAARKPGVIAGLALAEAAFRLLDPTLGFAPRTTDGDKVVAGDIVAQISGAARPILSAERVALNYLCRLSGIATLTWQYVERVSRTSANICCTRKTTPGLRAFEKYAVRCGGGMNHRFGLDDAFLIKDNHIAVAGGIRPALRAAKANAGHLVQIEIEVDNLDQLREVIEEGADAVLLDNMSIDQLREAVDLVAGRMKTEASGGINLDTVAAIAETGVDMISVGALTHSAGGLDLGLDVEVGGR
ncbi:MAG: carboxylating nicotinate-nucleotide diphosphorylase [Methylobacteriaceae bacterium]|nr:carboxylating nicotinate-nucleotide diphosphorylase [Methylobacteriaceae bacterium]MBV9703295.1 carboxylating nicotinate-nucleotide diphosphorylase [Methylobacteriaceae bacterium]